MNASSPRTLASGFTLIELLIALVIASILVTIAVPSYRRYILRSQRTDATVALMRIQGAQEKYFLQNNRYAPSLDALSLPNLSDGGYYTIELTPGAMEYEAKATPRASLGQTDDKPCQTFLIDHNSVKHATDATGTDRTNECWR